MPPSKQATSNKKRKQQSASVDEAQQQSDQKRSYSDLEKELLDTKKKLVKAEALIQELQAKKAMADTAEDYEDGSDDEESVTNDDPWSIKFKELREYRILNGDCKVSEKGTHAKLGQWVTNQKRAYGNVKKGKQGVKITPERIQKLDSIGMFWGKAFPPPPSWESNLEELQKRKKALGHCNVPMSSKDPSPLAKWVSYQRSEYKRFNKGCDSLLTLEQIGQLNEIGFNWKGPRLG